MEKQKIEEVPFTYRMTREDHKKLAAIAEHTGVSMAAQIRLWTRKHYAEIAGEKKPT